MKIRTLLASVTVGLVAFTGCSAAPQAPATPSPTPVKDVTVYVVRHGKTMLNTTDRVQGWADAPLTPEGAEVVKAAGRGLKDIQFDAAYSSDSGRAVETATLILKENKATKATLETDARLREFNFGTWEGDLNHTMWSAIAADQGITLDEFLKNMTPKSFADSVAKLDAANPEAAKNWPAENYETISARLSEGINDIVTKEAAKGNDSILLVSHGLSISALFDTVTENYVMPEGNIKNAAVSILKYSDGKFTLESVNDTSYIEKGKA
ncbi:MAG: histidine phosphatase family protein [Propioniciclava sp.]|uniref:histidine phosphatase family protein n=1 Tax=Propioniciclava sp. TaxID=2038686 RepID=UPI0039E6F658